MAVWWLYGLQGLVADVSEAARRAGSLASSQDLTSEEQEMFWKKKQAQMEDFQVPFALHSDGSFTIGSLSFGRDAEIQASEFFGVLVNKKGDHLELRANDVAKQFHYDGSKWGPTTEEELWKLFDEEYEGLLADPKVPENVKRRLRG